MDERALERLPRFSWEDLKKHIEQKRPFEALSPMGTALIRILRYEPVMGLAVHAGHRVREELVAKMAIDEEERRKEEDVCLEQLVEGFPMSMVGLDSRYEYDVDRPRDQSVYLKPFQSWGKKVWQTPPSKDEIEISRQKYDEFHDLLDYFIGELIHSHKRALLVDLHSCGQSPYRGSPPGKAASPALFDVGTAFVHQEKHKKMVDWLISELAKINVSFEGPLVQEHTTSSPQGEIAKRVALHHPQTIVFPVTLKNIYLEETGKLHELLLRKIADHWTSIAQRAHEQMSLLLPIA